MGVGFDSGIEAKSESRAKFDEEEASAELDIGVRDNCRRDSGGCYWI